jgi:hypothetical protein
VVVDVDNHRVRSGGWWTRSLPAARITGRGQRLSHLSPSPQRGPTLGTQ